MVASTNPTPIAAVPIMGTVEKYDWGIYGGKSLVAKIWKSNSDDNTAIIDENKPYAEFWMGTHIKAPSTVKLLDGSIQKLSDYLPLDRKALSIQAHPDKELARKLHQRDPANYKDDNHKPEMAIALTPFEALCGFRPIEEIAAFLESVPELKALGGSEESAHLIKIASQENSGEDGAHALQQFFARFITADGSLVKEQIRCFQERIAATQKPQELEALALRLNQQFPNEVGCFCVFLLNYLKLQPGEAIFLAANEPHAYLSGDCVECMALSDNVVRAGLTPKFRDIDTLVTMLTYRTYRPEDLAMKPIKIPKCPNSVLFRPPVKEFEVIKIDLPADCTETLNTGNNHSIMICVEGRSSIFQGELVSSQDIKVGSVLLLEPNTEYKFTTAKTPSLIFVASSQ